MDAECRLLRAHDNAFAYTLKTTCHAVIVSKDEYLAFLFFSFLFFLISSFFGDRSVAVRASTCPCAPATRYGVGHTAACKEFSALEVMQASHHRLSTAPLCTLTYRLHRPGKGGVLVRIYRPHPQLSPLSPRSSLPPWKTMMAAVVSPLKSIMYIYGSPRFIIVCPGFYAFARIQSWYDPMANGCL